MSCWESSFEGSRVIYSEIIGVIMKSWLQKDHRGLIDRGCMIRQSCETPLSIGLRIKQ